MGIKKTISLKKGNEYFNISGVFPEMKSFPDVSVSWYSSDCDDKIMGTLNEKTNKEIISLFKKLTDFMYWDILQFEADKSELTNLLSLFFSKMKPAAREVHAENRIVNKSEKLKMRRQFAFMNHFKFRGRDSKSKY